MTVERGKVLDSRVIELQKMTPLEIPVKKEYFPAIRVSVIAMYENNVSEETSRDFQVEDEGKTLRVDLESPGEIKPASKAKLKIKVSDDQKRGVKAKLFVYAVDEGNLSLQGYRTPDPLRVFLLFQSAGKKRHQDLLFEELHPLDLRAPHDGHRPDGTGHFRLRFQARFHARSPGRPSPSRTKSITS